MDRASPNPNPMHSCHKTYHDRVSYVTTINAVASMWKHSSGLNVLICRLKYPEIAVQCRCYRFRQSRSHLSIHPLHQPTQFTTHFLVANEKIVKLNTYWTHTMAPVGLDQSNSRSILVFHQSQCRSKIVDRKDKFDTSAIIQRCRHIPGADGSIVKAVLMAIAAVFVHSTAPTMATQDHTQVKLQVLDVPRDPQVERQSVHGNVRGDPGDESATW